MRIDRRTILAFMFIGFAGHVGAAPGQSAQLTGHDLIKALRSGGYVIVMRHASSPRTPPDAAHANPDNPQHERQLDEDGRAAARAMGESWRRLHIPVGPILVSPTYRAQETARLAQLSPVEAVAELGDQGHSMQVDRSGSRGAWLRAKVAQAPPAGSNAVLITHLPNLTEAFGADAAGVADGEALIYRPDGHGGAARVAQVKIGDWSHW